MAATEGPVVEFSGFANFEEKKRKLNLLMSFPKIVNHMGFGEKRKKLFFRFCRPIINIFCVAKCMASINKINVFLNKVGKTPLGMECQQNPELLECLKKSLKYPSKL